MRSPLAAALLVLAAPCSAQTLSGAYGDLSERMAASRKAMAAMTDSASGAAAPASPAPDFTLSGPAGSRSLGEYYGSVVVLEFWAGYAAATRTGAPARAALAARYAPNGVVMLDIGVGETSAAGFAALAAPAPNEVVLLDPDSAVFRLYGGAGVPMAVVIGGGGLVSAVVPGADPARVEAAVRRALGL
ncbi:MAG: redoxin domain-containing protein [Elusimicrobia bacterium]|nr:redoxin domain-containing protein [Elusimicrobiota bacterium]